MQGDDEREGGESREIMKEKVGRQIYESERERKKKKKPVEKHKIE